MSKSNKSITPPNYKASFKSRHERYSYLARLAKAYGIVEWEGKTWYLLEELNLDPDSLTFNAIAIDSNSKLISFIWSETDLDQPIEGLKLCQTQT